VQHHDIESLPNGNLLVLASEVKSSEETRRAGRRVDQIPEQGLWPDWLLEVEPIRPNAAKIVWEYRNPFSGSVRNADGSMPQPGLDEPPYAVYRATRISAGHPGLANRKLGALDPQPAWFDVAARSATRNPPPLSSTAGRR
jgi:hypothetical protein